MARASITLLAFTGAMLIGGSTGPIRHDSAPMLISVPAVTGWETLNLNSSAMRIIEVRASQGRLARSQECPTWNHPSSIEYVYDPELECFIGLDGSDELAAYAAVSQIGDESDEPGSQNCRDIESFRRNSQDWWEWTGWNFVEYNWDAATRWDGAIGFHYSWISDEGLWAHEGAHAMGDWDDGEWGCPVYFQFHCPDPPQACWEDNQLTQFLSRGF